MDVFRQGSIVDRSVALVVLLVECAGGLGEVQREERDLPDLGCEVEGSLMRR